VINLVTNITIHYDTFRRTINQTSHLFHKIANAGFLRFTSFFFHPKSHGQRCHFSGILTEFYSKINKTINDESKFKANLCLASVAPPAAPAFAPVAPATPLFAPATPPLAPATPFSLQLLQPLHYLLQLLQL
jgi:hypothetical protein